MSEGTSRWRAIQGVVIKAATVILRTVTTASKGGCISSSTRRKAGSARLPVTKRTRRTGGPADWRTGGPPTRLPPCESSRPSD